MPALTADVLRSALGVLEANGIIRMRPRDKGMVSIGRAKGDGNQQLAALLNVETGNWMNPTDQRSGTGYFQLMNYLGIDTDKAMDALKPPSGQRRLL